MLPVRLVVALLVAAATTVSAQDITTGFNAAGGASPGLVHTGGDETSEPTVAPVTSFQPVYEVPIEDERLRLHSMLSSEAPVETPAPVVETPVPVVATPVPVVVETPAPSAAETPAPAASNATVEIPTNPGSPDPTPTPAPTTNSTSVPSPVPTGICAEMKDKDTLGFDLGNKPGANFFACTSKCQETPGCAAVSWSNYEGGTCWLKTRKGKVVDLPGVSSGLCTFGESSVCKPHQNVDIVGNDIGNRPAKSVGECCDICNEFQGCKVYAWSDYNGGTCWLKSGITTVVAKPGVVSSSIVYSTDRVCPFEYDVDYVGADIGNARAKDAGVCCDLCKKNKDCNAYTWSNYEGGSCWMKSGKGEVVAAKGMVSANLLAL